MADAQAVMAVMADSANATGPTVMEEYNGNLLDQRQPLRMASAANT